MADDTPESATEVSEHDEPDGAAASSVPADRETSAESVQASGGTQAAHGEASGSAQATPTEASGSAQATPTEASGETRFCQSCGSEILAQASVCPQCGVEQSGASSGADLNPGLAAILSFLIPGAGQLYNGELLRGAAIFGGFVIAIKFKILLFWLVVPLFLGPMVWGFGIYDAYSRAQKINDGEIQVD